MSSKIENDIKSLVAGTLYTFNLTNGTNINGTLKSINGDTLSLYSGEKNGDLSLNVKDISNITNTITPKLSSGLKINSAKDDAAGLQIATGEPLK